MSSLGVAGEILGVVDGRFIGVAEVLGVAGVEALRCGGYALCGGWLKAGYVGAQCQPTEKEEGKKRKEEFCPKCPGGRHFIPNFSR